MTAPGSKVRSYRVPLIMIVILGLGLAVRYLFYGGPLTGWDDAFYSSAAARIANSQSVSLDTFYHLRFGIIAPIAVSYLLFGISPLTLALPFLISTVIMFYVLFRWGEGFAEDRHDAVLFPLIFAFIPVAIKFSALAWPSTLRALVWTLGFYFIYRGRDTGKGYIRNFVIAGLIFGYGYLINLSEINIIFVLGIWGCYLRCNGEFDRRLFWAFGIIIVFIIVETLIYYRVTGRLLYRWQTAYEDGVYMWNLRSLFTSGSIYFDRFREFWQWVLSFTTFGPFIVLAVIGIATCYRSERHRLLYIWLFGALFFGLIGEVKNDIGGPRFLSNVICPVIVFGYAGLQRLSGKKRFLKVLLIGLLSIIALIPTYRICGGTNLTRNRPLEKIAQMLYGKTGEVWTEISVMRILDFYLQYDSRLTYIEQESYPKTPGAFIIIDEWFVNAVTKNNTNSPTAPPVPTNWLTPPAGWRKLAEISHYRPYPRILGDVVSKFRPETERRGIVLYQILDEK